MLALRARGFKMNHREVIRPRTVLVDHDLAHLPVHAQRMAPGGWLLLHPPMQAVTGANFPNPGHTRRADHGFPGASQHHGGPLDWNSPDETAMTACTRSPQTAASAATGKNRLTLAAKRSCGRGSRRRTCPPGRQAQARLFGCAPRPLMLWGRSCRRTHRLYRGPTHCFHRSPGLSFSIVRNR